MNLLDNCIQDLRYAIRQLYRSPGLTLVVILSLALGIGANSAIFSAIQTIMYRPLPVEQPERLVMLNWSSHDYPAAFIQDLEGDGGRSIGSTGSGVEDARSFPYATYEYLQNHNAVFSHTLAIAGNELSVNVGLGDRAEAAVADGVSGNYFEAVGVPALIGRSILPEDDRDGAPNVAMVSYTFWQTKLGGVSSVAGTGIVVNGHPWTIVGVAPRGFYGFEAGTVPDLWIPLHQYSEAEAELGNTNNGVPFLRDSHTWWLEIAGRLQAGKTEAQAETELAALFGQSLRTIAGDTSPASTPHLGMFSLRFGLDHLRSRFSLSLFLLMAVVGLVLLIACGNVASLLLARASVRQREIAVRLSLGASRSRLIRQLLTESVLLALAGGTAGLFAAVYGDTILLSLLSSGPTSIDLDLPLNPPVIAFTFAVSVASGILFGILPALSATRFAPIASLKQGGGERGSSRFSSGKAMVVAQVALSLTIIAGAGLFLRTLRNLQTVNVGFDRDHLLLFTVRPGLNGYKDERLSAYYQDLQTRVVSLPGVRAATFSQRPPIGAGTGRSGGFIHGYTSPDKPIQFFRHQVGPNYFATLGIPLVQGRPIEERDAENAPAVVVVNEKLVSTYFHGDNPLGHTINFGSLQQPSNFEIVGVVKDVKYSQLRNAAPPTVYFSYPQFVSIPIAMTFEVRTAVETDRVLEAVRRQAADIDRDVPVVGIRTQAEAIDQTIYLERTLAALTATFAALALIIVCVGLYGTMSYVVTCRTPEIGIRMALGARRTTILWAVLWETFALVLEGLAIGLPLMFATTRVLKGQLFGLTAQDPSTVIFAITTISVVTLAAGCLPARRAATVAPSVALRGE